MVRHVRDHDEVPATAQDLRFATKAPLIKRSVVLTEDAADDTVALVATVIGADRQGIVNALSECAQRHGANWASSRLARAAGEFAGMVHFDVPRDSADALATSLRALESAGLRITVSRSAAGEPAAGWRGVELQLVGDDRKGIVSSLTRILAMRSVSIENMHTEIITSPGTGRRSFKVAAHLLVPASSTQRAAARRARRAGARDDARRGAGRSPRRLTRRRQRHQARQELGALAEHELAEGPRHRRQPLGAALHQVPVERQRKAGHVQRHQAAVAQLAADRVARQEGHAHAGDHRLLDGLGALDLERDVQLVAVAAQRIGHRMARVRSGLAHDEGLAHQAERA